MIHVAQREINSSFHQLQNMNLFVVQGFFQIEGVKSISNHVSTAFLHDSGHNEFQMIKTMPSNMGNKFITMISIAFTGFALHSHPK